MLTDPPYSPGEKRHFIESLAERTLNDNICFYDKGWKPPRGPRIADYWDEVATDMTDQVKSSHEPFGTDKHTRLVYKGTNLYTWYRNNKDESWKIYVDWRKRKDLPIPPHEKPPHEKPSPRRLRPSTISQNYVKSALGSDHSSALPTVPRSHGSPVPDTSPNSNWSPVPDTLPNSNWSPEPSPSERNDGSILPEFSESNHTSQSSFFQDEFCSLQSVPEDDHNSSPSVFEKDRTLTGSIHPQNSYSTTIQHDTRNDFDLSQGIESSTFSETERYTL